MYQLPVLKDNVIDYFVRIKNIPELTNEEIETLLIKAKIERDIKAFQELAIYSLKFMTYALYKYRHTTFIKDLIQESNHAILISIKRFDISKKRRFSDYCIMWIRAFVYKYFSTNYNNIINVNGTRNERKLIDYVNSSKILQSTDHSKTKDDLLIELSEELNIPISELRTNYFILNKLNDKNDMDNFEEDAFTDSVDLENDLIENDEYDYKKSIINKMMNSNILTENEKTVLKLRYLNDDKIISLLEISSKLGVSKQRIEQIEKKAIEKIKQHIDIS